MRFQEIDISINLMEGGHVFKATDGSIQTKRIALKDIEPTIEYLEKITGLPLKNNTLGSVGKKSTSGDIDLAVDPLVLSKDQLVSRLKEYVTSRGISDPQNWIKKSGISVHFKMPIRNNPRLGYVQVDFMFHSGGAEEEKWLKFGMFSAGDSSNYSGADRNLLMSSLAKAQGLKYSWQKGLIRRSDEQPISKDPDVIATKIFGPQEDGDVFLSVENMQSALDQNPSLKQKISSLIDQLASPVDAEGNQRKPGEMRKNQEEIERLKRLTGLG